METLTPLRTKCPAWNPVCIGHSIWISSDGDEVEKGMIEVCCRSNRIKQIVPYPKGFNPWRHSVCGLDGNDIMIINGEDGKMRTFNAINKKYGPEIQIPKLGSFVPSIMIRGYLHIMHGYNDVNSKYLVCSMADGTLSEFKENHQSPRTRFVAITKGPDDTFYKFGGYDWNNGKHFNSFYVGRLQHDDPSKPIQWENSDHFTLKKPLCASAYIHYNHWIIIFGGMTSGFTRVDDIYILDVRSKKGWIQSPIKCPMKSAYVAVLDYQQRVHLFTNDMSTTWNDNEEHHCIALNELIPELAISPMNESVVMRKPRQIQQQHDDEKGGDDLIVTVKVRNTIPTLKAMNGAGRLGAENGGIEEHEDSIKALESGHNELVQRLKEGNKKLKEQIAVHKKEQKEAQMKIAELEDKVKKLEMKVLDPSNLMNWGDQRTDTAKLRNQVKNFENEIGALKEKKRESMMEVMALKKRNAEIKEQIAVHEKEQKEAEMKIAELEDKVKELEMKVLDPSNFMEWDFNQIHSWIMRLEGGRFHKYDAVLKDNLTRNEVMGKDLLDVNPLVLRGWGIRDGKYSEALNRYIEKLVTRKSPQLVRHEQSFERERKD